MANGRIAELENWATGLRKTHSLDDVIQTVKLRLDTADDDDRYQLASILKGLLIEAGREREALRLIDEMIGRLPADVRFPIAKASLYFYFLDDPEKALASINVALARARQTGFFRREALGVKARILLKLGLGKCFSETLEEIMNLETRQGIPDIGRERDFLDRAPPGLMSEELRARYDAFCPKTNQ